MKTIFKAGPVWESPKNLKVGMVSENRVSRKYQNGSNDTLYILFQILKMSFRAHMARAEVRPHAQVRRNQIFELKCNLTTKKIESQSLKK